MLQPTLAWDAALLSINTAELMSGLQVSSCSLLLTKFDVLVVLLSFSVSLACHFSPCTMTPRSCTEESNALESCSGIALVAVV